MTARFNHLLVIAGMTLLIAGCVNRPSVQPPAPVVSAKPVQPPPKKTPQPSLPPPEEPEPPPPVQTVPPPPKLHAINWEATVKPLVGQLSQAGGFESGGILLVDHIKDSTNGSVQTAKATSALRKALASTGRFTLVSAQQLAQARQMLGLSPNDSLTSRSKAIGLARYVGAQYVLYSNAEGNVKTPTLTMQLMLVQSGEIIWSGKGDVQR